MKHRKGLTTTRQQLKEVAKLKPLSEVVAIHFKDEVWFKRFGASRVDEFFVPYELVRTEDLIEMMRRITIFNGFMDYLKFPTSAQLDRLTYLDVITEYGDLSVDVTEMEFFNIKNLINNERFMKTKNQIFVKLKTILATREHIPNKADKKIIRRLKSQGKYIID